jgi:hypothetical protein
MRYWMAVTGTLDDPLPDGWRGRKAQWEADQGPVHMFTRRPRIRAGDRLVVYATGTPGRLGAGRFYAVQDVISDPEPIEHDRWSWKVTVSDVITGPDLPDCPTIDEIGVSPKSLRRHTHIKLEEEAGTLAETLLERANLPADER